MESLKRSRFPVGSRKAHTSVITLQRAAGSVKSKNSDCSVGKNKGVSNNMQRQKSAGSAAGSVTSKNSDRSVGKYKRVSNNGGADESLFGSQPAAVCSRKVEDMIRQPPTIQSKSGIEFDSVVASANHVLELRSLFVDLSSLLCPPHALEICGQHSA